MSVRFTSISAPLCPAKFDKATGAQRPHRFSSRATLQTLGQRQRCWRLRTCRMKADTCRHRSHSFNQHLPKSKTDKQWQTYIYLERNWQGVPTSFSSPVFFLVWARFPTPHLFLVAQCFACDAYLVLQPHYDVFDKQGYAPILLSIQPNKNRHSNMQLSCLWTQMFYQMLQTQQPSQA